MAGEAGPPSPKVARKKVKLSSTTFAIMEEPGCLEGEQVLDSESVRMEDIESSKADDTRVGDNGGDGNVPEEDANQASCSSEDGKLGEFLVYVSKKLKKKNKTQEKMLNNVKNNASTSENLKNGPTGDTISTRNKEKGERVPPINVYKLGGRDLATLLNRSAGLSNFVIKKTGAERAQVKCNKIADYKKAREVLERVKAPHFTYTPKEEKVQTFLLKGLDAEEEPDEVLKMLRETGTEVKFLSVSRFSTRRSVLEKQILPHFLVQISPESRGSDLIGIRSLNYQAIRFERLLRGEIVQCRRCQRYGHSAVNCQMTLRCVKCGKDHTAAECSLTEADGKEKTFCVNCGSGGHPASYRGCPAYRNVKVTRQQAPRSAQRTKVSAALDGTVPSAPIVSGIPFAEVVRQGGAKKPQQDASGGMNTILNKILTMCENMQHTLHVHNTKINSITEYLHKQHARC